MSRKTKEEAAKTRARILSNALDLFVSKGYERTTFTDIAARLKMTKGAVYWHFASKESLLVELVKEMCEKFQQQLDRLMPKDELTFMAVAETMVMNAERIVGDAKKTAFFMLMRTQIRWGNDSMAKTREAILSRDVNGPYHSFIRAVENDIAAGRARSDVNVVAVASVCVSIWDGLVQSRINKFLECDLTTTLRQSFESVWRSISV